MDHEINRNRPIFKKAKVPTGVKAEVHLLSRNATKLDVINFVQKRMGIINASDELGVYNTIPNTHSKAKHAVT